MTGGFTEGGEEVEVGGRGVKRGEVKAANQPGNTTGCEVKVVAIQQE